ncbi:DODA-type extradiol aromatic ring-opening family dioxygenase [Ferribacterium limneticum]|uniref:DODA-type extradiol aromatic ring-opening family dioxygenase n=1 Tax=Ferribacterium limneticum TaxID=76259 RepID=UPI001CFBA07B|nr:class III extradiol ring-cleavage dioxygenase [Ferribacterium limneticum]UCV29874.1 dioxygenase [Ferribacterium limneticum]UCV33793.1 dioxygenase [Ferribacterium limneticum]
MTQTPSALFVPHGAPTFALNPGAAGAALSTLAASLPLPRAIVIVSAHWDTAEPTVGFAERPETIHDFWGFPEALYALRYPATGCREASEEVVAALKTAGLPVATDSSRGLDHGAWVPLRLMFPDAEVPVIPVSIQSRGGPEQAYRLGQALAPLAAKGFLVITSGNVTHNLRDYQMAARSGGQTPAYVREFSDWLAGRVAERNIPALLDYRRQSPGGLQAHPSEEHLLPFYVALGAGGENARADRFHAGIDDYVIAMDAYAFQPQ